MELLFLRIMNSGEALINSKKKLQDILLKVSSSKTITPTAENSQAAVEAGDI